MARKTAPLPRTDPALVEKVLAKHRSNRHVMSPGSGSSGAQPGCSCYVWVSGVCYSENCLVLSGPVEAELRALPHAYNVHINID